MCCLLCCVSCTKAHCAPDSRQGLTTADQLCTSCLCWRTPTWLASRPVRWGCTLGWWGCSLGLSANTPDCRTRQQEVSA